MRRSDPFEPPSDPYQGDPSEQNEQEEMPRHQQQPHMPEPPQLGVPSSSLDYTDYFPKRSSLDYFHLNDPIQSMFSNNHPQEPGDNFNQELFMRNNHPYTHRDIFFCDNHPNNIATTNNFAQPFWMQSRNADYLDSEIKREFDNRVKEQPNLTLEHHFSCEVKGEHVEDQISNYMEGIGANDNPHFRNTMPLKLEHIDEQEQNDPQRATFKSKSKCLQQTTEKIQENNQSQHPRFISLRRQKVLRYLEKKHNRNFSKKITYQCRKQVAERRIRWKGRFINYKQAVSELNLDPARSYDIPHLKDLIKKLEDSGGPNPKCEAKNEEDKEQAAKKEDFQS